MNAITQDTRFALRRLLKSPGFTFLAVVTLALGIGLNSAVFSVVNAVVLRPLPVDAPDELVSVYANTTGNEDSTFSHGPMAFPDYLDIRQQATVFEDTAAHILSGMIFEYDGKTDFFLGELATGNYFSLLGVGAEVGRVLGEADDDAADPQMVAVLSHRTWQRRFGGDPGVVGKTIRLNGYTFDVVGVADEDFLGMTRGFSPELWIPIHIATRIKASSITNSGNPTPGLDRLDDRAQAWHWVTGRLRPGATYDAARSEIATIQARLGQAYPDTNDTRLFLAERTSTIRVLPGMDGPIYFGAAVVMGLVSLVLLIACSNVANMLLARAVERRKEIATRLALGAGRAALLRQLLFENLALSFLGGGLGLGLALLSNRLLNTMQLPLPIDLVFGLTLDLRVMAFTFTVATLTAVLFGMAPALEATRTNLTSALRDESRGTSGGVAKRRLRSALVVAEVALSFLLLVCAGLSVRSMQNAQDIDPGFEVDKLVTAGFNPEIQGYEHEAANDFFNRLAERLAAQPGIEAVTLAGHLPLTINTSMTQFALPGQEALPVEEWPVSDTVQAGAGYFETLGVPIYAGRGINEQDVRDGRQVVVVNQAFAERYLDGRDAVGQQLHLDGEEGTFEIVGISATGKYRTLGEDPRPFVYKRLDLDQRASWEVVVRTAGDLGAAQGALRDVARELDEKIAVGGLTTAEDAIGSSLLLPRMSAALFGVFGLIGTLLAVVGIYGVVSYMVSQRTHEIGIRMAMGARRLDILKLVTRDGLALIGTGVALGVGMAFLVTRALESMLYGVSATDLLTFASVGALLTGVALVASLVPARRAASVHPMVALRWE